MDIYELVNKYVIAGYSEDDTMRENELKDIHIRLTNILNNNRFQSRINTANNNWLEIPIKDVIDNVLDYFENIATIKN